MLVVERKRLILRTKEIHFCDYPFDVNDCASVMFLHCKNKVDAEGFTCHEDYTSTIDLTQDSDTLWRNMDKKSTRYEIGRAEKEEIRVHINDYFDEFYSINKGLEQKQRRKKWFGIGDSLETMRVHGTLVTAEYNGEILGGHLYLEDEDHIKLWLSASKRLEADREKAALIGRANRLLHWEAMKYAKAKGIKEFDWGGLWSEEEAALDSVKRNINSFKQSFGSVAIKCYNYQKAYSKTYRLANYLYRLVSRVLK